MLTLFSTNNSPPSLTPIDVSPINSALPACGRALWTFLRSFRPVTQLVLLVTVPLELLLTLVALLLRTFDSTYLSLHLPLRLLIYTTVSAFLAPALIHIFHRSKSGRPCSVGAAIRFAGPLWPRSLFYRLQAIIYIFAGSLALLVPGLLFILFALLVDPVVALEPHERRVFHRSRILSRGMRLQFAAALTIIVIIQLAMSLALLSGVAHILPTNPSWALITVSKSIVKVAQQVLGALAVALTFELYLAARVRTPGSNSQPRAFRSRKRSYLAPKFGSSAQAGFSLVETTVAITVLFLAVVIGMQFLMVRAGTIALSERRNQAEESTEAGLNALATRSDLVNSVASFDLLADGTVQVTSPCQDSSCDLVYSTNSPLSLRTSVAGGIPFSARSGTPLFIRRWRFDPIDNQKHLYRITLVTLTDENATQPLATRSVEAVLNFQ